MLNVRSDASAAEHALLEFSIGQISRQRAMYLLGVDYSELLDLLAARGLSRPELTDEEAAVEGRKMVKFLDAMGV